MSMFEPGDQKVFGPKAFGTPSDGCANRVYAALLLMTGLLGIGCVALQERIAGTIMIVGGFTGAVLFLLPDIEERKMLRRMRKRAAEAAVDEVYQQPQRE